jgi:SAM-dependent methyltransferase
MDAAFRFGWRYGAHMTPTFDRRRSSPSALRNRDPILAVLRRVLPSRGLVLEIASGSGEHIVHFARDWPALEWQPSDPSAEARASIAAWIASEGLPHVHAPIDLDAASAVWPVARADAIIAINMVHISPWAATVGLMAQAGRILPTSGVLFLYGPYRQAGVPFAESNAAFDADLRRRDPAWGIRDVADVAAEAALNGLVLDEVVAMPANNLSLVFARA